MSLNPPVAPWLAAFNIFAASAAFVKPADATSYAALVKSKTLAWPDNSRLTSCNCVFNCSLLTPNDLTFASAKSCCLSTSKAWPRLAAAATTAVNGPSAALSAAPNPRAPTAAAWAPPEKTLKPSPAARVDPPAFFTATSSPRTFLVRCAILAFASKVSTLNLRTDSATAYSSDTNILTPSRFCAIHCLVFTFTLQFVKCCKVNELRIS